MALREKYAYYLASLKGSALVSTQQTKLQQLKDSMSVGLLSKTLNFAISVVQKLKEFGVTRVYLGKSGCMTLNTGNHLWYLFMHN